MGKRKGVETVIYSLELYASDQWPVKAKADSLRNDSKKSKGNSKSGFFPSTRSGSE
jgi:hypothetical protein